MAKTFNRRPALLSGPSSGDVKNYTYDNYKFTGFKEDKNFLEIDQYSFAEAENVYVDNDGLLRSRPSIKNNDAFSNIKNVITVGDVYIVNHIVDNVNKFYVKHGSYESDNVTGTAMSATAYGDKVYIFYSASLTNYLYVFDKSDNTLSDASDRIYIPEVEVQANGDATKNESKNVLTEKTKTTYLYTDSEYSSNLYDKNVTYDAFGRSESFVFNDNSKHTMLRIVSNVDAYKDYAWLSKNGVIFIYKNISVNGSFDHMSMKISYDGITFIDLPRLSLNPFLITMFNDGTGFVFYVAATDKIYYYNFSEKHEIEIAEVSNGITIASCAGDNSNNFYFRYYDIKEKVSVIIHRKNGVNYVNNIDSTNYHMYYKSGNFVYNNNLYTGILLTATDHPVDGDDPVFGDAFKIYVYLLNANSDNSNYIAISPHISEPDGAMFRLNDLVITGDNVYLYIKDTSGGETRGQFYIFSISSYDITYYHAIDDYESSSKIYGTGYYLASPLGFRDMFKNTTGWYFKNWTPFIETSPLRLDRIVYTTDEDVYGLLTYNGVYYLVTSNFDSAHPAKLTSVSSGTNTIILPEQISELSEYYFRVGNKLYISEYREDENGELLWYLPEINIEEFSGFVTMQPLSSTEMGIFTENGVYIVYRSSDGTTLLNGSVQYPYVQVKSKLDVKIRKGCDIISTYDGTALIVPTVRGLSIMTYQDFVQSTDQKLDFLSDTIYDSFSHYNTGAIKLYKYSYWIAVYKQDEKLLYLFDVRNGSWWPINLGNKTLKQIINYNDKPMLLLYDTATSSYILDKSVDNYYDYSGDIIEWKLRSQPLYLEEPNYYKHIQNLTLMSHVIGDNDDGYKFVCDLINTAYRSQIYTDENSKTWKYDIEMIRSYVLRLNYPKVCEFEYFLKTNSKDVPANQQIPLSLSNITVKYRYGGQIR